MKSKVARNNNLLTKPIYLGDNNIPMSIELIQYNTSRADIKDISLRTNLKDSIDKSKVNWIKITGISDANLIQDIFKEFGLHNFDVKDLLADRQIVKAVSYDDISFVLVSSFYQVKNTANIAHMQIGFILGKNFLVSFQEATVPIFDDVKKNVLGDNLLIREKGADFLLYLLLSAVNLSNVNAIIDIEDLLADIEDQLIAGKDSVDILQLLHGCRVDYTHIRRSIISLREEFPNLLHNTNKLIREENIVYYNDFDDRLRSTLGDLASFYESLTSLLDLYYNNNNFKMNEIIKRLTIVSTIFIPLTFMVGVWGMNFEIMPETDWKYGYLGAWIILIVVAILSYLWIRRQRWF